MSCLYSCEDLRCDGGLDRRALEVTYPASTGAAKSRTQATARERTQAGVLGSAYPSQVRAARGRSPASREGADQQPSLGGVSGSAGAGGKRASGVLFQAQHLHGRSSLGSGAPVVARSARCGGNCGMECHSSEQDARLAARSERLRATGPIWWLSSSRALSQL